MTLAHELGHHICGDAYALEASRDSERIINSFAIHFLAPRAGVCRLWDRHTGRVTRDRALALGASLRPSWSATVGHMVNLSLISKEERQRLSEDQPCHGDFARFGSRGSDEVSAPYLSLQFTSQTLNAYVDGRLTVARAIELLRGTLCEEDLPRQSAHSLDGLRASFAGQGG